jgi:hypothetical protein
MEALSIDALPGNIFDRRVYPSYNGKVNEFITVLLLSEQDPSN